MMGLVVVYCTCTFLPGSMRCLIWLVRFKRFRTDVERLAVHIKTPFGNRPELRRQAKKDQDMFGRNLCRFTLLVFYHDGLEFAVTTNEFLNLGILVDIDLAFFRQCTHLVHRRIDRTILIAAMHESNVFGLAVKLEYPVQCRVAATEYNELLVRENRRVLDVIVQRRSVIVLDACRPHWAWLERSYSAGDYDGLGVKLFARTGTHNKAVVALSFDSGDFFSKVHAAVEGFDLFQERLCQLLARTNRDRGDVVDRFVWIELRALTAGLPNRVDNLRFYAKKTQFKNLEQAAWTCSDNNNISVYHGVTGSRCQRKVRIVTGVEPKFLLKMPNRDILNLMH